MMGSAALGLLLGYVLFSPKQSRIPLDEWQPPSGQNQAASMAAEPLLGKDEARTVVGGSSAQTARLEQGPSAVQQFSELLHIPAATATAGEAERRPVGKATTSSPAKRVVRKGPSPARTAPARPAEVAVQVTEQPRTEPAKDQDAGLIQKTYRALASGAKSFGDFAGAAWDRIKP